MTELDSAELRLTSTQPPEVPRRPLTTRVNQTESRALTRQISGLLQNLHWSRVSPDGFKVKYRPNNLLLKLLTVAVVLLVVKVTVSVMFQYVDYFPPRFDRGFLTDREACFHGGYRTAFYAHIICGPLTLLIGLLLMNRRLRVRRPSWHRVLGRIQTGLIFVGISPAGFRMAFEADGGHAAVAGFCFLSVLTAATAGFGWRAAVQRRISAHQRWMTRCYLLLCSAVVLRLIAGTATVTGFSSPLVYPASAWLSWLLPLTIYEVGVRLRNRRPVESVRRLSHPDRV